MKPNANTYAQMAKLFTPPEFLPRVPEEVTADIRQFCELVVPASAPVFVSVQCGREGYETFQCHRNVLRHIAKHGGSMQHGWLINQYMEGHALDAIFHAVWKDPQTGDLIDVTPPESEGDQVLFLPDPKVKFFGIFVPGFTRLDWNVRGEAFDTLSRFAQEEFKRVLDPARVRQTSSEFLGEVQRCIGRSGDCWCGSKLKSKDCCLPKVQAACVGKHILLTGSRVLHID